MNEYSFNYQTPRTGVKENFNLLTKLSHHGFKTVLLTYDTSILGSGRRFIPGKGLDKKW
jgi:hypothetical protein